MYDLIGDIHGYADPLTRLLSEMGYQEEGGGYRHPEGRKVIFLGDFIDRGPEIRKVLRIARSMVEAGAALAVMGNHELNALAYHTPDPDRRSEYLRPHTEKNTKQHRDTLEQLSSGELEDALNWFRSLPLWLDLPGLRVVHACWDQPSLRLLTEALKTPDALNGWFLQEACRRGTDLYKAVEVVLKGKEALLPQGVSFQDKDGRSRNEMRVRWYLSPDGQTYRSYSLPRDDRFPDLPLSPATVAQASPYPADAPPVFFGHYWLHAERPGRLADNVACLDYSVAKGGFLCGYRWSGESSLREENFVVAAPGRP